MNVEVGECFCNGKPDEIINKLVSIGDISGASVALDFFVTHGILYDNLDIQRAWISYYLGKFGAAAELYENAKTIPESERLINIACCYFSVGRMQECKETLTKAKNLQVDDQTRKLRDRILACLRRSTDASDYDPRDFQDQLCLARILCDSQDYSRAIHVLSRLLPFTDSPEQQFVMSFISRCYYELGNFREALVYCNKSRELVDSEILRACCLYKLGNTDEADYAMYSLRHLENDMIDNNRCVFSGGACGDIVWSKRNETIAAFQRYNLGVWYLRKERYKDALSMFPEDSLLTDEEKFIKANALLGMAMESELDLVVDQLVAEAKKLLFSIVKESLVRISQGMIHFIDGENTEALECWEGHETMVGDWNMGMCLSKCGKWSEALQVFTKMPNSYRTLEQIVRCYIHLEKSAEAKRECERNPGMWKVVGTELVGIGNIMEAFRCFQKAVETSLSLLETTECMQGLNTCAEGVFNEVVETGKKHSDLEKVLVELKKTLVNNSEGRRIVCMIENWYNEHLS